MGNQFEADVIVVGAGTAGCYLALTQRGQTMVDQINKQISEKVEKTLSLLSHQEIGVLENGLEIFMKLCTLCQELEDGK